MQVIRIQMWSGRVGTIIWKTDCQSALLLGGHDIHCFKAEKRLPEKSPEALILLNNYFLLDNRSHTTWPYISTTLTDFCGGNHDIFIWFSVYFRRFLILCAPDILCLLSFCYQGVITIKSLFSFKTSKHIKSIFHFMQSDNIIFVPITN